MFKPTKAITKIGRLKKRIKVIQGGQGAGKTIGILMLLINHAQHKSQAEISVIQGEFSKMKKTVIRDFIKIMVSLKIFDFKAWNKSDSIYRFPNGSYIEFMGLDRADVGKGLRRDAVFFNEINAGGITHEAYNHFASRARVVIVDYNPDRRFWLHDEVIGKPGVDFITLTYKDNQYLSETEVQAILEYKTKGFHNPDREDIFAEDNIKSKYWANKWRVYGLGQTGIIDGVVFNNWDVIKRLPEEARYVGTGLDFGYTNDPTAIIDVYEWNGKRILDQVVYRTGLLNGDIARLLKGKGVIYADSAEPKSIKEIRMRSVDIRAVKKGADSIVYGIGVMQELEYLVTARSKDLIFEFENYTWDKDKDGMTINKPVDMFNHGIDAVRYHEMMTVGLKVKVFTF
jgi:phage terminase large subunit